MPDVILPTRKAAQDLCDQLDALLGIPDPVRYPGTATWAVPRELADGTWAVPVPRKGPLAELLDALDAKPVEIAKLLTEDQIDGPSGKVARAKRATPAELADVRGKLNAARVVRPDEEKPTAAPLEAPAKGAEKTFVETP